MRETLGNRMSKKLKEYGISQRLLATLTHTTEVSVSRYVNDKRIPKADVLYRIACALHTTTDYLLGLTTSEQTNEEWFCQLSTEEKARWLYDHYVNARADEYYGRQEKTLSEYQKWLVSVHRGIDGTKID